MPTPVGPPNDEIWYTSLDGKIVTPYDTSSLPEIVSNTYSDGKGIIKFKTNITSIGNAAFAGCSSLTSINISNSVTNISGAAFADCGSLTTVLIPNSITSIGNQAFYCCDKLTSVTIPNGVTAIESATFYHCTSLSSVTIPNNVTRIGNGAFDGCSGLTSIICKAITPPMLNETSVFVNTNNCPIYVPAGSVNAYKAAENWTDYANRICAISE